MRSRHALAWGLGLVLALGLPATASGSEGEPAGDCPVRGALTLTPSDAQGTTFVGTYLGDSVGSSVSPQDMLVAWSVERVYAGRPVPADLVHGTPACAWTNLTPGVRYLFSTAVTGLDGEIGADARPSVHDSIAWELRPDGTARLAPFDSGTQTDHTSDELADIDTFEAALAAVAPGSSNGFEPAPAIDAGFGCLATIFVAEPDQARGTTFIGTYIGDQPLPGPGDDDARTYWSIESVYAGGPLPEVLTMRTNGCGRVTLEPGQRYLFSTSAPLAPAWANSLAWRLRPDGTLRLAGFEGTRPRDYYPRSTRAIREFDEALAAVAPGAGAPEPPLRDGDRTPG